MISGKRFDQIAQRTLTRQFKIEKDAYIHVSRFSSCARRGYYSITKLPPKNAQVTLSEANWFSRGTATEIWYITFVLMKMPGVKVLWPKPAKRGHPQWPFRQKHIIVKGKKISGVGSIDAIIKIDRNSFLFEIKPDNDYEYIVEIKSKSRNAFDKILKANKPDSEHYLQVQSYLHFPKKRRKGMIVYIDRDDYIEYGKGWEIQRNKTFVFDYDPVIGKQLQDRLHRLEDGLETNIPPPKEGKNKSDKLCALCNYRPDCWNAPKVKLNAGKKVKQKV